METIVNMPLNQLSTHRALRIEWDAIQDVSKFRFEPEENPLKRRGILFTVSSLFDPLGLIAPI